MRGGRLREREREASIEFFSFSFSSFSSLFLLPSVSEASITPPSKTRPSTDVPVT